MKLKTLTPTLNKFSDQVIVNERIEEIEYDGDLEVFKVTIEEGHLEDSPYFLIQVKTGER